MTLRILFLLCPLLAFGQQQMMLETATPVQAAPCSIVVQSQTDQDGYAVLGLNSSFAWVASWFVSSSTTNACGIRVLVSAISGATNATRFAIYNDGGTNPATLNGSWSEWLYHTNLTTTPAWVAFTNMSPVLTNGSMYWLVANASVAGDSSKYGKWYMKNGLLDARGYVRDGDGTGKWTMNDADAQFTFKLVGGD